MSWEDFAGRLRRTLGQITDRCYLIIASTSSGGRNYVQFAGSDTLLAAESSGPEFAVPPGVYADGDPRMVAAGWTVPTQAQPNWWQEVAIAARGPQARMEQMDAFTALAERCVTTLRDVLLVPSPSDLTYRAWRDPEYDDPGSEGWQRDLGQNPMPLPSLGLSPSE